MTGQSSKTIYGNAAKARAMFAERGLNDIFVTSQKAAGSYWVAAGRGQIAAYFVEQPLQTVAVEDERHQKFSVVTSVRPTMLVDNPYGLWVVNGINA